MYFKYLPEKCCSTEIEDDTIIWVIDNNFLLWGNCICLWTISKHPYIIVCVGITNGRVNVTGVPEMFDWILVSAQEYSLTHSRSPKKSQMYTRPKAGLTFVMFFEHLWWVSMGQWQCMGEVNKVATQEIYLNKYITLMKYLCCIGLISDRGILTYMCLHCIKYYRCRLNRCCLPMEINKQVYKLIITSSVDRIISNTGWFLPLCQL